jgi:bifunctional UDP-N-acetylglucosamine pyrophosphorylase/glucosamine-1-phosphate N-acetyltransferase
MNILILAAGKGTRMKSALPKVLHPVGGRAMVARVVDIAQTFNEANIILIVGHGAEQVQAHFQNENVHFALQAEQLGTGHAVQCALSQLNGSAITLILYGDVPLIQPGSLQGILEAAHSGKLGLLTMHLSDPHGYGRIVRSASGQVEGIVEQKDASAEQLAIQEVNTGILACPTEQLKKWVGRLNNNNAQQEYYLTDIIQMAYADGLDIQTAQPQHAWEVSGVNSRSQQADLERIWQQHQARQLMDQGVHLFDPLRLDIRGHLTCDTDVSIDVGCVFEGRVHLEKGVTVGPYCILKDVTVGEGTRIDAYSHLHQAKIGRRSVVGPYARLRPGAQLGNDVHIGNFVEVKNATIADSSKANHLSYIGDARIGQRVNIGAGTITCNYDGVNKHLTVIEDDAFIGSDTQLVAPVTVKRGATLGAGTTLTKDAPEEALTVSRAKQITLQGWVRPIKNKA